MWIRLAASVVLALGCSEELPAPATESRGISFEVTPPPVGEQSELFAEAVPIAAAVAPVPETPPAETPPPAPRKKSSRDAAAANAGPEKSAAPQDSHLPLESLLRTPGVVGAPSRPLDLEDDPESPSSARQPGALDEWKDRVRVKRSQESIGHAGPRQGTVSHTEAGLRVPVDDAVSLEGGVRVDSRDEPGLAEPERSSIPRVGVEVKF
jgi:hypothetical protein